MMVVVVAAGLAGLGVLPCAADGKARMVRDIAKRRHSVGASDWARVSGGGSVLEAHRERDIRVMNGRAN